MGQSLGVSHGTALKHRVKRDKWDAWDRWDASGHECAAASETSGVTLAALAMLRISSHRSSDCLRPELWDVQRMMRLF